MCWHLNSVHLWPFTLTLFVIRFFNTARGPYASGGKRSPLHISGKGSCRLMYICFFNTPWLPPPANSQLRNQHSETLWGTVGLQGHTTANYALHAFGASFHFITLSSLVEGKVIMCLPVIPKSSLIKITWTSHNKRNFKNSFLSLTPEDWAQEPVVYESSQGDSNNDLVWGNTGMCHNAKVWGSTQEVNK